MSEAPPRRRFKRPRHLAVDKVLHALDADLLTRAHAYFAGGTAVSLALGEYRESLDIDFLCASQDGYRLLRERIFHAGLDGIMREGAVEAENITIRREARADQYGIRAQLVVDDVPIRLELVRETRIDLSADPGAEHAVPVLSRADLYCEKLLANADRGDDRSTHLRDLIDLTRMIQAWGPIPEGAWQKARRAYGSTVDDAYARSVVAFRDPVRLEACLKALGIDLALIDELQAVHGGPLSPT